MEVVKEYSSTLEDKLKNIPENPGVYLMKNGSKIIYVGKAKNLRKRVLSYFNKEHEDVKTKELVKNIEDIEFFICSSEVDALILENNLIKKYSPKYNIVLKDHKTYPYIRISKEKFPTLKIIRSTKELDISRGLYFGPYPIGSYNLKRDLLKIFKIRDCNRDMNKIYSSPCLKYFMHLCTAPCIHKDIVVEYTQAVEGAIDILKGDGKEYIFYLEKKMEEASIEMKFEEAILYREQIKNIKLNILNQIVDYKKYIDEDYIAYEIVDERMFILVLGCREGKIVNKNLYQVVLKDKIYEDIFELIMLKCYSKQSPPENIVLNFEIGEEIDIYREWIKRDYNLSVDFYFPKIKSRRKELLSMAELNLKREIEEFYRKKEVVEEGLKTLYERLRLKNYPRRIECFDISNIQGKDAVASMSVALEGIPTPKEYRKFKILTKDTPDDFEMMREVIYRRYSKLSEIEMPDLILIDGGLGQVNAAGEILKGLGRLASVDLLGLAKEEEEIYRFGETAPYQLGLTSESTKIFQRVRDEAHRFGVSYHRKLRSKRVISSKLDNINGIGEKRKKALYERFKNFDGIIEASLDELSDIVPIKVAQEIKRLKN